MSGITQKKELRHFWVRCVDESVLFVRAERALFQLERSFSDVIKEKYDISPNKGWQDCCSITERTLPQIDL